MKISQLKEILADRGLECKGCAEKADIVKMVSENYHLPIVEKKEEKKDSPRASGGLPPDGSKVKDEELEELMRKMGSAPGMNGAGFKMFRPQDFQDEDGNIDQEKMRNMMGDGGGRRRGPGRDKQDL